MTPVSLKPRISFIVPTAGRPSIEYCLASIVPQLWPGDEVLVIGDITDGPLARTEKIVESFGPQAIYMPCPVTEHSWGHREINFGMTRAEGDWLSFNDDDDIWTPGSVDVIHSAVAVADG